MPELILRLHAAHGARRDVIAVVEPSHTVGELTTALAAHAGVPDCVPLWSLRHGRALPRDVALDRVDLVTGDEVRLGAGAVGAPGPVRAEGTDLSVDIVCGPASGHRAGIAGPGRYPVGRAAGAAVRIDDRSVSRHHATIEITPGGIAIVHPRPRTANGVHVNGVEVDVPTALAPTDLVGLGATRFVVRPVPPSVERRAGVEPGSLGRIDFHRTPYRPACISDAPIAALGPIPDLPEPRRLSAIAALAPLAAGVAMYLFTRQVQFLALTLLSPVAMIGTTLEDRRAGRRAFRARAARFRCDLAEHRDRVIAHREQERRDRLRAAPDIADLVRRAERRTLDLWPRGRDAPDVLVLRVGLGPATVRFPIEVEPGGDDELRGEAEAALSGLDQLVDVPVTVHLTGVVAVHGERTVVDGLAGSLLVQAATLHSPEDLTIAAAVHHTRPLPWIRWLPHTRAVTSPLVGDHVAGTRPQADQLVERLLELAERRSVAAGGAGPWPRLLVVVDAELAPDPARTARLLDVAPEAGIAVLWLAASAAAVPRQATRTLVVRTTPSGSMRGRLWSTDPTVPEVDLEVEHLGAEPADRVARALAPIRDASTVSLATMIPRTAPLLDVLGVGRPTAAWVIEHWQAHPADALRFPIGIGPDGPVELDLVADGPHALIGGTSGAGKSELLQSMVAALATRHPPTRLNFLFVDYKGGAATQVFERLPHTVGYVTNLTAELAGRALTSLRAELTRRMTLLEGRAKDLTELLAVAPDDAPASLVIVVDEFATLGREVPDFVTGIVDVAQRGRSLGIHLVLATQRPSGAVNENILANTNLRIALRMLDRAESNAVVGVPDAADIPVPLRGRGVVRLGPRHLVEFQAAFGGAPLLAAQVRPPVRVASFDGTDASPMAAPADTGALTQLESVLDAIVRADRRLRLPAARRPWRDVLPPVVDLRSVLTDPVGTVMVPGRFVPIGMLDVPARQDQRPAILDLEDGGGLIVFGAGGAGATTLLRTVAAAASSTASDGGDGFAILAFDMGGRGLASLAALPSVVDVVPGDDLEAVTRYLLVLEHELDRRRTLLAGVEHLTAAAEHPTPPARLLLLVDGLAALIGGLLDGATAGDEWIERLVRIVIDGRRLGVHAVLTADRRASVPARLHAAIANRLVLRQADAAAYGDHGLPAARGEGLVPGRGWWTGPGHAEPALVQVASVARDPSGRAQSDALAALGARLGSTPWPAAAALRSVPLPDRTDVSPSCSTPAARPPRGLSVVLGPADVTGAPVVADLDWSHLTVCGPPRSGRSTALAAVVMQLAALPVPPAIVVGGPVSSPLRALGDLPGVSMAFGWSELAAAFERSSTDAPEPWVLVLDDLDSLDDPVLLPTFERLARNPSVRLVSATEGRTGFTTNPLLTQARRARRMVVLQPDDAADFLQLTGTRLTVRPGLRMPPGRGVALVDRVPTVVQVTDALGVSARIRPPAPAGTRR